MATIINKHLNLHNTEYNFRQIAKIREKTRKELQPCFDERFMPARVDYNLLGDILRAKHEKIMNKEGKTVKDFNRVSTPVKKINYSIGDFIISLIRKISKLI